MGFFNIFGKSKKEKEAEEAALEEEKVKRHEEIVEEQKKAHEGFQWPVMPRINQMNVKRPDNDTAAPVVIEDPLTEEDKNRIGNLIYEPELKPSDLKGLNLQELLFLEAAINLAQAQAKLQNFEENRQAIHTEFLNTIRRSENYYLLYDNRTGYPLIDNEFVQLYLDEEHAKKGAALYQQQYRAIRIMQFPGMFAAQDPEKPQALGLFDVLYFLGDENIIVDNGYYKGFLKRSEISAPFYINKDPKTIPPHNPALVFAINDYLGEFKWPVNYPTRQELLKKRFDRILAFMSKTTFLVPAKVEDVASDAAAANGDVSGNGDTATAAQAPRKNVEVPGLNVAGKRFLPVFTDVFEYIKAFKDTEFRPNSLNYQNVLAMAAKYDGFIINPKGQGLVMQRQEKPAASPTQTGAAETSAASNGAAAHVADGSRENPDTAAASTGTPAGAVPGPHLVHFDQAGSSADSASANTPETAAAPRPHLVKDTTSEN